MGKFNVRFVPSLPTNLFPLKRLQEIATSGIIRVGSEEAYRDIELTLPSGVVMKGKYVNGILILDSPKAFVATVRENEARFDRRQVVKTRRASQVHEILGYPSTSDLVSAARHGSILDIYIILRTYCRKPKFSDKQKQLP
jgi:hypothetical protein